MISFSFLGEAYQTDRIIGHVKGDTSGPVMVFFGGVHGNERSGVVALKRVFNYLESNNVRIRGEILGLAGNLEALQKNQRFMRHDLNRIWNREFQNLDARSASPSEIEINDGSEFEKTDQRELFQLITPFLQQGRECFFLDLHTTSSPSVPFIAINDQLTNRDFALKFPVPTVLGIEEYLEGTILSFLNDFGHIALAFEAGQHDSPDSIDSHEAFIFLAMEVAGLLPKQAITEWDRYRQLLHEQGGRLHGLFEVFFRHALNSDTHAFKMNQGFANFDKIEQAQPLAIDRKGEIHSPDSGHIFMPLYQDQGDDGFFLVKRIPKWALVVSRWLRGIRFDAALTWLPGVSRSKDYPEALHVNKRIARFLSRQLFHLLGYRRKKENESETLYVRREVKLPDHFSE